MMNESNDDLFLKLEGCFSQYDKSMDELKTTIEKGKCMEEFQ
jgi:hypothetical protein